MPRMPQHVIIDGNNLLHAMHAHAPIPHVGRETLVRVVERWAGQGDDDVTLVYDGPSPAEGMSRQMDSSRIRVRFSQRKSADDIIVEMIHQARKPDTIRIVSGDTAVLYEARTRKCAYTDSVEFVGELFAGDAPKRPGKPSASEKPREVSPEETDEWLKTFGIDEDEPFDGYDAMMH